LIHGGNPVLRWNADNLVVEIDSSGNFRPSKKRSREKIDGIVALIMGLSRSMVADPNEGESIYADIKTRPRGIVVIGEEEEQEEEA
jgi:phage terminase large subunit-like protein